MKGCSSPEDLRILPRMPGSDANEKKNKVEGVLRAAKRDPYEHSANVERQVWRRNAAFRAWASRIPLEAAWRHEEGGVSLQISCTSCQKTSQQKSDITALLLVKDQDKVFSHIEKKSLRILREFYQCGHLNDLLAPPPEEIAALIELELLVGP
jgi:hypothetical protein